MGRGHRHRHSRRWQADSRPDRRHLVTPLAKRAGRDRPALFLWVFARVKTAGLIRNGGGATGTIRPATSPRIPTTGFEGRGSYDLARPQASIKRRAVFAGGSRQTGPWCPVRRRPPALLSRLLSKPRGLDLWRINPTASLHT